MNEEKNFFISEYREMLDFILEQQEAALKQSDILLSKKKDLDYKIKQQEYMMKEQEKKRVPNISMFSPLSTEDVYQNDMSWKEELEQANSELSEAERKWEEQKKICDFFERLRKFFTSLDSNAQINLESSNLTNYSVKLLETQEMDRNRISRDLHDSTVQCLTGLVHKMEYCSKLVDKDPVNVKLELQSMIDLNKDIINGMREIIYDLRPMSLNNIGLVSTIESYCLHLRRYNNLDVVLKVEGKEQNLTSIVSVTLYRIIQEACNNVIRHARAKKLLIRIAYMERSIELDIEDNGTGFDLQHVEEHSQEDSLNGFGLSTMRERARLLSGSFYINSKPGAGTKIHVDVPVNYTSRKEEVV